MLLKNEFSFMPKSKIKASEGKANGLYPFFTSSNLKVKRIDEFLFNDELIIIGTGGLPSCNYYDGKFGVSTDNFVLKSKGNILPKYLYYYLRNNNLRILADGFRGTGLKHISKDYVSKIEIPFASIDKQELVVKAGNTINALIKKCQSELNYLDMIVKSRFIEMFGKDDGDIPLDQLCKICRGASPRPISNYITTNPYGINWIKIGDVEPNAIYIIKTKEKITKEGAAKSRKVYPGDFILSNSMSFGRPYILGIDGCVHDGWLIISNYQKHYRPLFLYFLLRSESVQNQFSKNAGGTTVKNLNSDLVKTTKVNLYPLDKQDEFVNLVEQVDKLKFNVKKRIELYQELLNKKMDEYFD